MINKGKRDQGAAQGEQRNTPCRGCRVDPVGTCFSNFKFQAVNGYEYRMSK